MVFPAEPLEKSSANPTPPQITGKISTAALIPPNVNVSRLIICRSTPQNKKSFGPQYTNETLQSKRLYPMMGFKSFYLSLKNWMSFVVLWHHALLPFVYFDFRSKKLTEIERGFYKLG
jgi:hypothetical protein